jgi:glycosyltransferase involved in cell wall biosynthesis
MYFVTAEEFNDAIIAEKPDIIHAHDLYTLPAAMRAAKACGAKVIYDAHEYERYRKAHMNWIHRFWIRSLENSYVKNVDGAITVSQSIADAMAKSLNIKTPSVIYNSPPMIGIAAEIKPDENKNLRTVLGLSKETPLVVNVSKYYDIFKYDQKLYLLIEALKHLPQFHLAILGYKAPGVEESIKAHAAENGVYDRVYCVDPVSFEEVPSFIASADIGAYSMPATCLNIEFCMPNKLFEQTLAGLPVVIAETKDAKTYIDETKSGGTFKDPWDPKCIAETIRETYQRKDEFKKSDEEMAQIRRKYSWEAQVNKMLNLYSNVGVDLPETEYRSRLNKFLSSGAES